MSERLPVGDALNETFQFALHRWTAVLRLGWAPLLLTFLIGMGLAYLVFDMEALRAAEDDPTAMSRFGEFLNVPPFLAGLLAFVGVIATMLILSGFMASLYRLAALGEDRPGLVHIRFDGPAIRVFFAQFILGLINFFVYVAALLVASIATGYSIGDGIAAFGEIMRLAGEAAETGRQIDPQEVGESAEAVGVFALGGLFALLPLIYLNIRLAPFAAGSAAENRLILAGAFALTRGQFWSVFGYYVLLVLALLVLAIIFQLFIGFFELLSALPESGAFAAVGFLAGVITIALTIAYQLFTMGLQLGGQAIIYRRLKTGA